MTASNSLPTLHCLSLCTLCLFVPVSAYLSLSSFIPSDGAVPFPLVGPPHLSFNLGDYIRLRTVLTTFVYHCLTIVQCHF